MGNINNAISEFLKSNLDARSFLEGEGFSRSVEEDVVSSDFNIPPALTHKPEKEDDFDAGKEIEKVSEPEKRDEEFDHVFRMIQESRYVGDIDSKEKEMLDDPNLPSMLRGLF